MQSSKLDTMEVAAIEGSFYYKGLYKVEKFADNIIHQLIESAFPFVL